MQWLGVAHLRDRVAVLLAKVLPLRNILASVPVAQERCAVPMHNSEKRTAPVIMYHSPDICNTHIPKITTAKKPKEDCLLLSLPTRAQHVRKRRC
jgi:hypothetical protein